MADFLNKLITFLLVALIIYVFVVLPSTSLAAKKKKVSVFSLNIQLTMP